MRHIFRKVPLLFLFLLVKEILVAVVDKSSAKSRWESFSLCFSQLGVVCSMINLAFCYTVMLISNTMLREHGGTKIEHDKHTRHVSFLTYNICLNGSRSVCDSINTYLKHFQKL